MHSAIISLHQSGTNEALHLPLATLAKRFLPLAIEARAPRRHPDIASALNGFREDYLRKLLPRLLTADLPVVALHLRAHAFSGCSDDEMSAATAAITLVTPQRIEAHLREWITPQIPNSSFKLLISFHRTLRLADRGALRSSGGPDA